MVQRVDYYNVDDRDGTKLVDGEAQKVPFAIDGTSYELDLTTAHAEELRELVAPFLTHAEPIGGVKPIRRKRRPVTPEPATPTAAAEPEGKAAPAKEKKAKKTTTLVDFEQNKKIREWANESGYKVSDRGRISPEIRQKYEEAHQPASEVEG